MVVGNMIGSGVFLLPAALASYGSISIFGWIISALGASALAFVFIQFSKIFPSISGGPYAYSRKGLGDFAGFLVAWGYWVSIWCSNAAISVAFVSYLSYFIPLLAKNSIIASMVGVFTIWIVVWINTRGIRHAGLFQLITSIIKITPLIVIGLFGVFLIDFENLESFNISEFSNFRALIATATLTFFAYMGIECASIPAADVDDPTKTISRATYFGLTITAIVYVMGSTALMGIIPPEQLQNSNAPFADVARVMWGDWAGQIVAAAAIVSTLGALNGWTLIQGQIPTAIAKDGLFPKVFSFQNKNGAPAFSLIVSGGLVTLLMLMNYSKGLVKAFEFILLLSTMTSLLAYLFTSASYGVIVLQSKKYQLHLLMKLMVAGVAFFFAIWAIAGSGQEIVYWGFLLLIGGIPIYIWIKGSHSPND